MCFFTRISSRNEMHPVRVCLFPPLQVGRQVKLLSAHHRVLCTWVHHQITYESSLSNEKYLSNYFYYVFYCLLSEVYISGTHKQRFHSSVSISLSNHHYCFQYNFSAVSLSHLSLHFAPPDFSSNCSSLKKSCQH